MANSSTKILSLIAIYYLFTALALFFCPKLILGLAGIAPLGAEFLILAFGAVMLALAFGAGMACFFPGALFGITSLLFMANLFDLLVVLRSVQLGSLPIYSGIFFLLLDLFWVLALAWVLYQYYCERTKINNQAGDISSLDFALRLKPLDSNLSLAELSEKAKLLLIYVRHSGCTFCRAHLAEIAKEHELILKQGAVVVIAGLSSADDLKELLRSYPINGAMVLSDPDRILARALGARRASLFQLFGPKELWSALVRGALFKYGIGRVSSDPLQLGGTFVIHRAKVIFSKPAKSASEICPLPKALSTVQP